jgi:malonyl-CoA O-methyltransferase
MAKKERIKQDYNKTAFIYNSRYREIQFNKYKTILFSPYIAINSDYKILDLGCGTGLLFEFLDRKNLNLIGIDISNEMLKISKAPKILGDIENLPFKTNSFNLVLSFTVIQNLPTVNKVLKEANRVLKSNGVLAFTILRKKFPSKLLKELAENNFSVLERIDCSEDVGFVCRNVK